jgi:hypothetical protein
MTESGIDRLLIVRPKDRQPYWNGTSQITIQAEAADAGGHCGLIKVRDGLLATAPCVPL